jgi:L-asparaginase
MVLPVAVLETGGTINGVLTPGAPPPTASRVFAWLQENGTRLRVEPRLEIIFMKDSRAISDHDRAALADAIEDCPDSRILIPHGTYTMPETGQYLRRHLGDGALQKHIVLVGALVPLNEPGSDAPAALEFALASLRNGERGVWIAMNQTLWDPAKVRKDPVTGAFVALQRKP